MKKYLKFISLEIYPYFWFFYLLFSILDLILAIIYLRKMGGC